jgi:sugar lactone lactonase YvrE
VQKSAVVAHTLIRWAVARPALTGEPASAGEPLPAPRTGGAGAIGRCFRVGTLWLAGLLSACGGGQGSSGNARLFSIQGFVTGLAGTGLVLHDSAGDTLPISGNGVFTFPTRVPSGLTYEITIQSQPTSPAQTCSLSNASGSVNNESVTGVEVSCVGIGLLAGALGGAGYLDGMGSEARFLAPGVVAVDSNGNLYTSDANYTIRKISPAGLVSTFAGMVGQSGSTDGLGSAARFTTPGAMATDASDNIYVADDGTIRKITPAGYVSTLAGAWGQSGTADGQGAAARFGTPSSMAVDSAGNLYVLDALSTAPLRKVTPAGLVSTPPTPSCIAYYGVIAIDAADNLYFASQAGICKLTPSGLATMLLTATLQAPFADNGLTVDAAGNLYVPDTTGQTILKVTQAGAVSILAGSNGQPGSADGTAGSARFNYPFGIAIDRAGNLYVADSQNDSFRKVSSAGVVTTVAGEAPQNGDVDGAGSVARFDGPAGVAADSSGNVYVADQNNSAVRKIARSAAVSTLADKAAGIDLPAGLATDVAGNVYVADRGMSIVRRISAAGAVSTFAGSPFQPGSADGQGAAAQFRFPQGVAADSVGNLYVTDSSNGTIRRITPDGTVSTLAGSAGQFAYLDGAGAAARFGYAIGIVTDRLGNVYVADSGNNAIRMITPSGVVSTLAGGGGVGAADGSGKAALFNEPVGLAIDTLGNLYVADFGNNTIRKISPGGMVTTVAGTVGLQGVRLGPLPGSLNRPWSLAVLPGPGLQLAVVGFEQAQELENAVLEIVQSP